MTIEEIFNKIGTHMQEGIMFHNEMKRAYSFLGLWGYAKEQEYHIYEEEQAFQKLQHYYASHYFKLLQIEQIQFKNIFSTSWYKYSAQAVDATTRRNAIKDLITKWIEWEKDTKKLYEEMYLELTNLREVATMIKLQKIIEDVDKELSHAQIKQLNLEAIDYDIVLIIDEQLKLKKKYRDKIKAL